MSQTARSRYSVVAIVLHWAIALAIALMIALGWWMGDALEDAATRAHAVAAIQLHKSVGLSILVLSLARLAWRLSHRAPPLPEHMPAWEKRVASATHWVFYALIILMPMSGWLYVSTGWSAPQNRPLEVPTLYFGLFQVPHLFGLSHLAEATRAGLSATLEFVHSKLAWVMIVLAALHVGAALKHHIFDRDDVLTRMVPGLAPLDGVTPVEPPARARLYGLIAGFALITLALVAGVGAFQASPAAPAPPAAPSPIAEAPPAPAPEVQTPAVAPTPQAAPGAPSVWIINRNASLIGFSGTHSGAPFSGQFETWTADIRFDPADLAASRVVVTIAIASAKDGVALHEQSLAQPEWFDSAKYPNAVFRSRAFTALGAGRYQAEGTLRIKTKDIPVAFPFTLRMSGDRAWMEGALAIDRAAADLGQESDPGGDWVSKTIDVRLHVEAARAP